MSYVEELTLRLGELEGVTVTDAAAQGSLPVIPFPLTGVYIITAEKANDGELLLGDDEAVYTETAGIIVYSPEKDGRQGCLEAAERVCLELLRTDSGRMITAISSSGCSFDSDLLCYEVEIKVSIRPHKGIGG